MLHVLTGAPADLTLKRRLLAYWHQHGLAVSERLRIHVQGGVVTLRGSVFTAHEKRAIPALAARVAGVRRVIDRLQLVGADIARPQPWTRTPLTLLAS